MEFVCRGFDSYMTSRYEKRCEVRVSRTVGKAGGDTAVSRRVEVRMQEDMEGDKAGGLCKAKRGQYANMEGFSTHH